MDYRFYINERNQPQASLSMGHEAFGDWLSHDIGNDVAQCQQLLQWIDELTQRQRSELEWHTTQYTLQLDREEAMLTARYQHDDSDDALSDPDLHVYQDESEAGCGLDDLRELICAWLDFLQD